MRSFFSSEIAEADVGTFYVGESFRGSPIYVAFCVVTRDDSPDPVHMIKLNAGYEWYWDGQLDDFSARCDPINEKFRQRFDSELPIALRRRVEAKRSTNR